MKVSMIQPRRVSFDLSGFIPKHWLDGDPVKTHFLNAFSVVLPTYEQFFIQTVYKNLSRIQNPDLKNAIQGFCQQEGSHAAEHRKYNQLLMRQGYAAIPRFEKFISRVLVFFQKKLSTEWLLAWTAGGEHITAFMGKDFLARPEKWSKNTNPNLDALWRWHAIEEVEHQAVCFDVYQEISGRRWLRNLALISISLPTIAAVTSIQLYLLWKDGLIFKAGIWRNYFKFMLGTGGFLHGVSKEYLRYFKNGFHPG
jgi:predicted metal-dependent hydrolase